MAYARIGTRNARGFLEILILIHKRNLQQKDRSEPLKRLATAIFLFGEIIDDHR